MKWMFGDLFDDYSTHAFQHTPAGSPTVALNLYTDSHLLHRH